LKKSDPKILIVKEISIKESRIRAAKREIKRFKCTNLTRDHTKCKKTNTCKCQECSTISKTQCSCRKCERKRFPSHLKKFSCSCKICTKTPDISNITQQLNQEYRYFNELTHEFTEHPKHNIEDIEALATHYQQETMIQHSKETEEFDRKLRAEVGVDRPNLKKCQQRRLDFEYKMKWRSGIKDYMAKMKEIQRTKNTAIKEFTEEYHRMPPCFRERMSIKCKNFFIRMFEFFLCIIRSS
jgi:hypothetical protein